MRDAGELKKAKKALRAHARAARGAIPAAERSSLSKAIAERLDALPQVKTAKKVLVFSSFGDEIETEAIIERLAARGTQILLPRVAGSEMEAVPFAPGDPVTVAPYGAEEPADGEAVAPGEIDVVVVPGLAFDREGHRVGYGGGFYDRFLRRTRPDTAKIGICFGSQVMDEVPHGRTDLPVSLLVTEDESIECG